MSNTRTARARVLRALENAGEHGITNARLGDPAIGGGRFGARVHELREAGYVISCRCVRPGRYRYVLHGREEGE